MPKGRYKIMREYMPKKGKLGLDMMLRTCTVQANLDFASEADMVKKFRVGAGAAADRDRPVRQLAVHRGQAERAICSYRSHIWTDTDPDRSGMLAFVFEDGFGFERYVDYMLDVPMYFVYRDGKYIDWPGQSFRDFMEGKLPALPGELPTINDWADHITTAFPEVRLKRYLEMRGADGGPWPALYALPALVGRACSTTRPRSTRPGTWSRTGRPRSSDAARRACRSTRSKTPFRNVTVRDIALEALRISHQGLRRRAIEDAVGRDETQYLAPLFQIAEADFTPAEDLLCAYNRRWDHSVDPVFREYAY